MRLLGLEKLDQKTARNERHRCDPLPATHTYNIYIYIAWSAQGGLGEGNYIYLERESACMYVCVLGSFFSFGGGAGR